MFLKNWESNRVQLKMACNWDPNFTGVPVPIFQNKELKYSNSDFQFLAKIKPS